MRHVKRAYPPSRSDPSHPRREVPECTIGYSGAATRALCTTTVRPVHGPCSVHAAWSMVGEREPSGGRITRARHVTVRRREGSTATSSVRRCKQRCKQRGQWASISRPMPLAASPTSSIAFILYTLYIIVPYILYHPARAPALAIGTRVTAAGGVETWWRLLS